MSYAAVTKTWGDISANLKRSFGDESGVQLEEGDIVRWINQGQYEIARANKILKEKGTTPSLPGQSTYALALGRPILQIESIRHGNTRLVPTQFTTVDANYDEYPPDAQGDPRIWYRWGDKITLWPSPKKSEPITVFYTAAPLSFDTFEASRKLELPDTYFQPLFDFCLAKAHEMDDNPQAQEISLKLFTERVTSMNDEERGGQSLTYSTITIVD